MRTNLTAEFLSIMFRKCLYTRLALFVFYKGGFFFFLSFFFNALGTFESFGTFKLNIKPIHAIKNSMINGTLNIKAYPIQDIRCSCCHFLCQLTLVMEAHT